MEDVAKAHVILLFPQSSSFKSIQFSLYPTGGWGGGEERNVHV